jgi:hemolysin activation/secretion protein
LQLVASSLLNYKPILLVSMLTSFSALSSAPEVADNTLFNWPGNRVTEPLDDILNTFGASKTYEKEQGLNSSIIPTAYYTPEKGLGIGALYVGLYNLSDATLSQPSSVSLNSYYSENGSYGVSLKNKNFFESDNNRLFIKANIANDASYFYGLSGQSENVTHYTAEQFSADAIWLQKTSSHLYIGFGVKGASINPTDIEKNTFNNTAVLVKDNSIGGSIKIDYDSRDNVDNAFKGINIGFQFNQMYSYSQSERYEQYQLYYSQYHHFKDMVGTLAWQVKGEFNSDDTPFVQLANLGGDDKLRGYLEGKHVNNHMVFSQVEYRVPLYWRIGMVFWTGAGAVANDISALFEETLVSYGTGFRFNVKDRVNIRADIGFGDDGAEFYLNINEVF